MMDDKTRQMAEMYFEQNMSQAEIGAHFGITPQSVSKHLNKRDVLDEYDERRNAHALRAKIKIAMAVEQAVDVQRAYLDMELPINLEYLRQNAARDILDRAGVKEKDAEDKEFRITWVNPEAGIKLGIPNPIEDKDEIERMEAHEEQE